MERGNKGPMRVSLKENKRDLLTQSAKDDLACSYIFGICEDYTNTTRFRCHMTLLPYGGFPDISSLAQDPGLVHGRPSETPACAISMRDHGFYCLKSHRMFDVQQLDIFSCSIHRLGVGDTHHLGWTRVAQSDGC